MSPKKSNRPGKGRERRRRQSTAQLIARVRKGDAAAREDLIRRNLTALERAAHGRLPARARDVNDTGDLVQNTLMRALKRIDSFRPKRKGSFFAYLRTILRNLIKDEARRVGRRPTSIPLPEELAGRDPSPLEEAIGKESMELYERALACLPEMHRQAIILRLEFDYSYAQIAEMLQRPSPDAARMMISRAIAQLAHHARELEEKG